MPSAPSIACYCSYSRCAGLCILQVYNPEDTLSASLMRTSPTGALTPPVPGMRPPAPAGGNLTTEALAALLAQAGGGAPAGGMPQYSPGPVQTQQQPAGGNGELLLLFG